MPVALTRCALGQNTGRCGVQAAQGGYAFSKWIQVITDFRRLGKIGSRSWKGWKVTEMHHWFVKLLLSLLDFCFFSFGKVPSIHQLMVKIGLRSWRWWKVFWRDWRVLVQWLFVQKVWIWGGSSISMLEFSVSRGVTVSFLSISLGKGSWHLWSFCRAQVLCIPRHVRNPKRRSHLAFRKRPHWKRRRARQQRLEIGHRNWRS